MPTTFADLMPKVRNNLGGRTDITTRIYGWLEDAYKEIAMGFDLETLEATEDNLTVAGIDSYPYPATARAIKALTIFNLSNQPVQLFKKNIQVVRKYQAGVNGLPSLWAPFGNNYILRVIPDNAYTLTVDYWELPVIDTDDVALTEVKLPLDWMEILVYGATERGHQSLQESDKAAATHQIVFGDPRNTDATPGLLKARINRNAAESSVSDFGFRPRIRRYTSSA
jgi:hypothetical protein